MESSHTSSFESELSCRRDRGLRRGRRSRTAGDEPTSDLTCRISPQEYARSRAMASRGRSSSGASSSNRSTTCSAQSAAQAATRRRFVSSRDCGEGMHHLPSRSAAGVVVSGPTGPRPAQAADEASESASFRAISTRFARSTTGGSVSRAQVEKPALTRAKQNPRHVEARRGFLG